MSAKDNSNGKNVYLYVILIILGLFMLVCHVYLLGIVLPLIGVVRTAKYCKAVSARKLYQIPLFLVVAVLAAVPIGGSIIGTIRLSAKTNEPDTAMTTPTIQGEYQQQSQNVQNDMQIPVDIPKPRILEGYGDDVLSIVTPDYPFAFYITGNSDAKHFSVTTYNSAGEYGELLVNTTEAYSGFTIDPSYDVASIEVKASGAWKIELRSIYDTGSISADTKYSGYGDAVLLIKSHGTTAHISGNAGEHHFAVWTYGVGGDLLVNTTEVYNGTVLISGTPTLLVVKAVGEWSIQL